MPTIQENYNYKNSQIQKTFSVPMCQDTLVTYIVYTLFIC